MDYSCYVYWIHRPCETDILTQGYVGITKDFTSRFKSHVKTAQKLKARGKNHILYNALNKYPDFIFEVILLSERAYCLDLEAKLRPQRLIGLNVAAGGSYVADSKVISKTTREKISEAVKVAYERDPSLKQRCGNRIKHGNITEEGRKRISEYRKHKQKAWNNPKADRCLWLQAELMYLYYLSDDCSTSHALSKKFNYQSTKTLAIFNHFKNGWNPFNDIDYQTYKKKELKCH